MAWTTRGKAGPEQRTLNIASVIQEVVNRLGWASGNSLVVIITGTGKRTAESYNADPTRTPLLHVEYMITANDPPVATDDGPLVTAEDTLLLITAATDLLANDTDVDGDTFSITTVTQPAHGSVVDNADGTYRTAHTVRLSGPC